MSYAIKEKNKQVYVAKEQFGLPDSLMLAREGENSDPHYHPASFATEDDAKNYLKTVVQKTRTGRRHIWEIVEYG